MKSEFIELSVDSKKLVELAVEYWRLEKRISKVSDSLNSDQNESFANSLKKFERFFRMNDIAVEDYAGMKYNEGMNVDILSMEKMTDIEYTKIHETVEPTVFVKGQLVRKAKVIIHEK